MILHQLIGGQSLLMALEYQPVEAHISLQLT
nr:MAG TPA: hypothetical protein [Caudoviricetes sp.]